jgi:hypothetical protein
MSGAEAGIVIGFIASLITIFDATEMLYDAAKDVRGQPEAFRQIAARLPLVIEILRRAKERALTVDETTLEALEPILKSCHDKAERIVKIFQDVVRTGDERWHTRYKKAVGAVLKENLLEYLMQGILTDIQVLACGALQGIANNDHAKQLEDSIQEMHEMPDSLPVEAGGSTQTNGGGGGGDRIWQTGPGTMNIHRGGGDIYHNVISRDANFGSKK